MKLEAQVLGTGAEGHVASVVVSTERSRVLFNVGEGTQRMAGEHGVRLSRSLDLIALTRLTWHHIGGLQDLLARSKPRRGALTKEIVGPPNIAELMLMTQYYMWSVRLALNVHDVAPAYQPAFTTADLTVQPVLLLPSGVDGSGCVGRRVELALNFSAWSKRRTPPPVEATVCYVCRTAEKPGTFDARKAAALGIKGAQCRLLVQGESVVAPDGRTVQPADVISPSTPGSSVWIVDCPSMEFVAALIAQPLLSPQSGSSSSPMPACIFHMTPNDVLGTHDYARWMNGFGAGTQHVVLNKDACPPRLIHVKAAQRQAYFNQIDARLFPLPCHSHLPLAPMPKTVPSHCVHGDNLLKFFAVTQPRKGKQEQGIDAADLITPLPVESLDAMPGFAQSLIRYREALADGGAALSGAGLDDMPDLRTTLSGAVERGLCTLYATGKSFASQDWFSCRTCHMERGYGCCVVCAVACHAGHDLVPQGTSEGFYCDCGSASGDVVPWKTSDAESRQPWRCCAMNGVSAGALIRQFFPRPKDEVLDDLRDDGDSELVFLGTAAASPSKLRNVSSIYLHLKSGGIIMDAGEGTYGQLLQRYGRADIDRIMLHLKICFISHMHGDHLLGLVALLLHRTELERRLAADTSAAPVNPIVLVAPLDVHLMLEMYNRSCPVPLIYDFIECRHVHYARGVAANDRDDAQRDVRGWRELARAMDTLGLAKVETAEVVHACNSGARAHALALTSRSEPAAWKIVYSGDTLQPCQELIELGTGATVLIHEATFAQDKAREARRKFHTTTEEAIEAGMKMGASRVVLTHFSHQYVRSLPPFAPNARAAWATDLMNIRLSELRALPLVVAPMSAFFAEQERLRRQRGAVADDDDGGEEPYDDDIDSDEAS